MKKIYNYLLPVLLSVFVVSCDGDDEEIVNIVNQDPVVTVTEISPNKGYEENEFTVKGTNFGIVATDVKVYVGNSELEVVSCEDEAITVKVPQGSTAGRISVIVYGQRVDTQLMYDVLGNPGVTKIEPVYGFVGDEITFSGHDLGVASTFYSVLFTGKTETAQFVSEPTNESFVVKVPSGARSGEITLTITDKLVNLPAEFTVLQHATLEKLSLEKGFAGSEVTITGANLNPEILASEGLGLDGIRVFFKKGKKDEPVAAEIVGEPTNTEIKVKVPADLVADDYEIAVSTSFEDIEKTLAYTVLPTPEVTSLSVQKGYINAEVIISGSHFGSEAEKIKVYFDDVECSSVKLNEAGNIVVNVPKGITPSENVAIRLVIMDTEISMGEYGTFNVLQTPEINSVHSSYIYPYGTLVEVGEEITLTGHDFDTNKDNVTITFEGVAATAEITNITSNEITVKVPDGFSSGKVTVIFKDIDEPVVSDDLTLLPEDGDITAYTMKNYQLPFERVGDVYKKGEWAKAAIWTVENSSLTASEGGVDVDLTYPNKDGDGNNAGLGLQTDWGFPTTKENGKIYQTSRLLAGTYKLTAYAFEYANKKTTGYLTVCAGSTLLNTDDVPTQSIGYTSITSAGEIIVDFTITEPTDVAIGFVCTIGEKQGRVKINNFKLELIR